MKKIRLIRTTIVEYEPKAEYYDQGATIEEMAQFDADADDRDFMFENCCTDNVKWEVVEDEKVLSSGLSNLNI